MNTPYKAALAALAMVSLIAVNVPAATYTGGATFVARDDGMGQLLDAGGVMCRMPSGDGVGGACIPWDSLAPGQEYASIADKVAGTNIAFQVCVDNNGDGLCGDVVDGKVGGTAIDRGCRDTILFSHDDDGNFFNPLGPMPLDFPQGCEGGFPGWVVFLCEGVHESGKAHSHAVTTGSVTATSNGSGSGTFCGGVGELNVPPKPYVIVDEGASAEDVKEAIQDSLDTLQDAADELADFLAKLITFP